MKRLFKVSLLTLLLVFCVNTLIAKNYETERVVAKEYSVKSDAKLYINNKYGDINIYKGSSNKIKIEIKIKVKSNREDAMVDRMNTIDFNFSNSSNLVMAETIIQQPNIKTKGVFNSGRLSMKIDYNVYVPQDFKPDFVIEYGDINFKMPVTNSLKIEAKHADITASSLLGALNEIKVEHGDVELGTVKSLKLDASNADFSAKRLNNVEVIEFRHGDISIDELNSSFICKEIAHSSVEIDECSKDVEEITIFGKYTNIELAFPPKAKFKGSLYTKNSKLNIDEELDVYLTNLINKSNTLSADLETKSSFGSSTLLNLRSERGDISLDVY